MSPKRKGTPKLPPSRESTRPEPRPDRPLMPKSYSLCGPASGQFLPWRWANQRLQRSRNYWVATTRPDGRPHVMPVWGVWLDGRFYFSSDRRTRKARNLTANPRVVVHLESGDDAVILEGVGERVTLRRTITTVDDAYYAKYRIRFTTIAGQVGLYAVRPRVAFAWRERDFNRSATRWLFVGARGESRKSQRRKRK